MAAAQQGCQLLSLLPLLADTGTLLLEVQQHSLGCNKECTELQSETVCLWGKGGMRAGLHRGGCTIVSGNKGKAR